MQLARKHTPAVNLGHGPIAAYTPMIQPDPVPSCSGQGHSIRRMAGAATLTITYSYDLVVMRLLTEPTWVREPA